MCLLQIISWGPQQLTCQRHCYVSSTIHIINSLLVQILEVLGCQSCLRPIGSFAFVFVLPQARQRKSTAILLEVPSRLNSIQHLLLRFPGYFMSMIQLCTVLSNTLAVTLSSRSDMYILNCLTCVYTCSRMNSYSS